MRDCWEKWDRDGEGTVVGDIGAHLLAEPSNFSLQALHLCLGVQQQLRLLLPEGMQ